MKERLQNISNNIFLRYVLLGVEIVLLTILMLTLTRGRCVEYDESYTWWMVTGHSYAGIIEATAMDVHPPLYYFIAKLMMGIFGEKLPVLASVSVIPVVLLMVLASHILMKNFGFLSAVVFNVTVSISPYLLNYNVESRMYSWMNFFVIGVILLGYEIVVDAKVWKWVIFVALAMGAVYTQYFAVLPILVCYVWMGIVFLVRKEKKDLWSLIISAFACVVLYIPWLSILSETFARKGTEERYEFHLSLREFMNEVFTTNLEYSTIMMSVIAGISIMLVLIQKQYHGFGIMLVVNIVFCFVVSQVIGKFNGHFFAYRYILYVVDLIWLVVVLALTKRNLCVSVALLTWCSLLGLSSYRLVQDYRYNFAPLMPQTEEFIAQNMQGDDILACDLDNWDILYGYYVPGHEWLDIRKFNPTDYKGKTVWVFRAVTPFFNEEECAELGISSEHFYGFGFMGAQRFELEKVVVQ